MASPLTLGQPPEIEYPDSDGQPMSDNTLQSDWIILLKGNLDIIFKDALDVFVACDLLWYPVQGHPEIRAAPDALVAFGRPKGYRGSYKQWEEGGIAPQVVFEVLSPGNRPDEMADKLRFYDTYGVEEYYLYDPDKVYLSGWRRVGQSLQLIPEAQNWVSPRLKIRFDLSGPELVISDAKGQKFLTVLEREAQREQERQQREKAEQQVKDERLQREQERQQREKAEQQVKDERLQREKAEQQAKDEQRQREKAEQQAKAAQERAEQERLQREKAEQQAKGEQQQREKAEQQAGQAARKAKQAQEQTEQERSKREQAEERMQQLADRLRELGIDPDSPSG